MRTLLATLLLLISALAWAQIYSWRDAEGKVHYSDQPPPGVSGTRKLEPVLAPAEDAEKARRELAKRELDRRKSQLDSSEAQDKAGKEQGERQERQKNCDQARAYLRSVESGERIARSSDGGERVYLDDQARVEELVAARRAAETWCK